jgi:ABC-2 type transport system ATP-binding protein
MIEAHELTKRYGDKTAVHTLSFTIAPGTVTGFLGPNGAGKSTTMRLIMGLDRPTSGTVTVNGKPYGQHRSPLREVGALLDARAVHPGRSARSHLRTMAATHNIKTSRVSEVIEMTGLAGAATKRVGGFSLGMSQRLGIAAALLGDPGQVGVVPLAVGGELLGVDRVDGVDVGADHGSHGRCSLVVRSR